MNKIKCRNFSDYLAKLDNIARMIEQYGFVIIQAWNTSKETLLQVASPLGNIQNSPLADEEGIVEVYYNSPYNKDHYEAGRVARAKSDFFPHTDASFLNHIYITHNDRKNVYLGPPALVLLQCVSPAVEGGDTIIIDGAQLLSKLRIEHESYYQLLTRENLITFAREHYVINCSLVDEIDHTTWRLRFRREIMCASENRKNSGKRLDRREKRCRLGKR